MVTQIEEKLSYAEKERSEKNTDDCHKRHITKI